MRQSVEGTLTELVRINSISSRTNDKIISYLKARSEALGLRVKLLPYSDERGIQKTNMIALAGIMESDFSLNAKDVELALVGHTDTVPFDPSWTTALQLTERGGALYGRGACDTKGFVAAALIAVESVDLTKLRRPLALVFTADEETGCMGAKELVKANALRARYSIIGEPTSLQPMRAGKGYCLAEIIVRGREGHSAYPALGASAIMRAARLIHSLERIGEELKNQTHADFDPPYTTINIGLITGGTVKNIIAGECRFTLEWRPIPGQSARRVLDLVEQAIADERWRDSDFNCEIKPARIDESVETLNDSPLVRFLEEATGKRAGTVAFGTEAAQMQRLGAQTVVVGPGNIRTAHRTDECVPIAELHMCVRVLARAIERFCL